MNALVISDLHAHTAWPFSRPLEDGTPSRFADLLDVLNQVAIYINQDSVSDLIIAGDLTHRRHFINFTLYNRLLARLFLLTTRVRRTHILVGNHDYETDTEHSLYPLSFLPNTTVYEEPELAHLSTGEDVYMIPYLHDPAQVAQAFERAPAVPVFSHYAAEGAPMETTWWLDSPVKLDLLDRFPLVVFGHVHKPGEQLGGKVVYVGAPMHFDFGDHGPRSCLHINPHVAWAGGGDMERLHLDAPVFATAIWPRLPAPVGRGYLRILDVPQAKLLDAHEAALAAGWLDAVALPAAVPPEVREAITAGLLIDRPMLEGYVARRCRDLPAEAQAEIVEEGLRLLEKARG